MNMKKIISAVLTSVMCFTYAVPAVGSAESNSTLVNINNINDTPMATESIVKLGDIDSNKLIDAVDATAILRDYSLVSTGSKSTFNSIQKINADVNLDKIIDSTDASCILSYYAYTATGGKLTIEGFLGHSQTPVTTTAKPVVTSATTTTTTTTKAGKITTTIKKVTSPNISIPATTVTVIPTTTTTVMPVTTTNPVIATIPTNVRVSGIRVTRNEMNVNVDEGALSAYVTMLPAEAKNKSEIWTSSDESIAIVDSEGWVIGVGEGQCVVTVKSVDNPDVFAEIKVNVKDTKSVKAIRLSREAMTLKVGTGELSARVTMLPETAVNKNEIWSSSRPDIATVDNEGWVIGYKAGNTIITVQSEDDPSIFALILVTVTEKDIPITTSTATTTTIPITTTTTSTTTIPATTTTTSSYVPVSKLSATYDEINVNVGETRTAVVSVLPENATNKSLVWSSSDTSKATVDQNGKIIGISEGICVITATSRDNKAIRNNFIVNIKNEKRVTGITLSKYEMNLAVGSSDISMVTMLPSTATNKEEFWISSDTSVATVDEYGWVYGVKKGECIITVYSVSNHDVKAQIKVKVTDGGNEQPEYSFSQIAPKKSTATEIAFLTPIPKNANGRFIIDYVITDANGKVTTMSTSTILAPVMSSVTTMLTASTNHFRVEAYLTNLSNSYRARIGIYNFVINPRDARTEEEAIEYAFSYVGGLA